jgi:hypothetical protein
MLERAPGYRDILTSLLTEGNAQKAITLTVERSRENAYSFAKYCRHKILGDEANRRPEYLRRVREFQHVHFSPQDEEWEQLNRLMEGRLRFQYRVETSRRPYLRQKNAELQMIRCLPDAFYEYKMPDDIIEDAVEREILRREAKHLQPMSVSNVQTILSKAREWRQFEHPWDLVACASILCGRRTQEILWSLTWERKSDYVATVGGILKQRDGAGGDIPILTTYDDFHGLMTKIREHQYPTDSTTHRLKPAFLRVFGEWFNHTARRNIYCEAGYRLRHESGFYPTCSKIMWCDQALCHDTNVASQVGNLVYQTIDFSDE